MINVEPITHCRSGTLKNRTKIKETSKASAKCQVSAVSCTENRRGIAFWLAVNPEQIKQQTQHKTIDPQTPRKKQTATPVRVEQEFQNGATFSGQVKWIRSASDETDGLCAAAV